MRKVFKKLFSSSSTDVASEKSRKFSTSRNRLPNLINQIKSTKSRTTPAEESTSANVERITRVERSRNEPIAATLHAAVAEGNTELVEELLSQGVDTGTVDENGLTPFLKAVKMGNVRLVNVMVQRNKFQTDTYGNTALHIAVNEEFLRIAEILVTQDPLVNVPNKVGDLPLHVAVGKECFSIVELLLRNKAVMDVEDSQKRTPLFIALKLENIPLIQLLLNYGAHKNDHSIIPCLSTIHNPKIKTLFRFLDYKEKASTSLANDDDSQNSEFTLPPVLDSPKSWNILHPKRNSKSAGDNITNLLPHKRRKHFNKVADDIGDSYENSLIGKKSDSLAVDNRVIEDCKKALIELSLNVQSHAAPDKLSGKSEKTCFRNSALLELKSLENCESKDDLNQNYLHKDQSFVKFTDEFSSSSDEEPLMWENSNDGGYFTEWSRSSKLSDGNEIENSKSSTSDEDVDNFHHDKVYSAMLNSLKQVTQDNKDLETESAVLRESVEKLKYDLANSREDMDTEKINSLSLMSHLTNFDEKYLKAVENVGTSQLYITNLEKEISHLKRAYNESCKMNRFLAKELRKALADIASIKSMKCRTCESRSTEIDELRAEISEWRSKYDDLTQHYVGTNSSSSYLQETKNITDSIDETLNDIMKQKLLLEVTKLNSIIKDKEKKEEKLRNQVHELRTEVHKSKSEKRNMLIKKTFHDKYTTGATKKNTNDAQMNFGFNWN